MGPLEFSLLDDILPAQKEQPLSERRENPFAMIRVPRCLGPAMIDSGLESAWAGEGRETRVGSER